MIVAPSAIELQRLNVLRSYRLLDTGPDALIDSFVNIAGQLVGAPVAALSLVDENRQWFKSISGSSLIQTPRDVAFCAHTIQSNSPLLVPDTLLDPRFSQNKLVVGQPNIRFYLGAPLISPEGCRIGALCSIDTVPRSVTPLQCEGLTHLASSLMTVLELWRTAHGVAAIAMSDALTNLPNRLLFDIRLDEALAAQRTSGRPLTILYLDCDNFKQVNDARGHEAGDTVLRLVADELREGLRKSDLACRVGGDEFVALLPDTDEAEANATGARLMSRFRALGDVGGWHASVSMGLAVMQGGGTTAKSAMRAADAAMYEAKSTGKGQFCSVVIRSEELELASDLHQSW